VADMNDYCKKITVKEASQIIGKSEQFIRIGLQRGLLPFGVAFKMSSQWTYLIYPEKLKEYIGVTFTNVRNV
jgi:hypothetical protein